jgi:hypothetical protein
VPSETHADRDDQVWGPSSNSPIVNREVQGVHVNLILRVVSRLGEPVRVLVPQWLRNSIDEKADGNTSAEMTKKIKKVSNGTTVEEKWNNHIE